MYKRKYALAKDGQPDLGQHKDFKLMDFQVRGVPINVSLSDPLSQIDGFNWLCNNWWNMQHCILADEMGLVSPPHLFPRFCETHNPFPRVRRYRSRRFWGPLSIDGRRIRRWSLCPIPRSLIGFESSSDGRPTLPWFPTTVTPELGRVSPSTS